MCKKCNGLGYTLIACKANHAEARYKCDRCNGVVIKSCMSCKNAKFRYYNIQICGLTKNDCPEELKCEKYDQIK